MFNWFRTKPNFAECAKLWNISELEVKKASRYSSDIRVIFLKSKGITETRMQSLYYQASEAEVLAHRDCLPSVINPFFSYIKWWATSSHPVAVIAQRTLDELLNPGNVCLNEIPFEMSFAKFAQENPHWGTSEKSFVFFRDHHDIQHRPNVLIQRRQKSGNCYIHGPIVAYYYLQAMRSQDAKPVDIRKFVLQHLDVEHLSKVITRVGGGASRYVFQTLVGDRAKMFPCGFSDNNNDVEENLRKYGPGLITGFQVEQKFHGDSASHGGAFHGPVLGSHSMVLVGIRRDENNKPWILIQNWWRSKQFCEVDSTYFTSANATILFCKGLIGKSEFTTRAAAYDEADLDSAEEQIPENL